MIPDMDGEPRNVVNESSRVETFSDSVLAIALTLLVLNLRSDATRGQFARVLADQWPGYLAYRAAFLNIAAIWTNHHDLFTRVRRIDNRALARNLLVLLAASLLPWPASVVGAAVRDGDQHDQVLATMVYASVTLLLPLAFAGLYFYFGHVPELLTGPGEAAYCRRRAWHGLASAAAFPIAALVGLFAPSVALTVFVAVPALFLLSLVLPRQHRPSYPRVESR